MPHQFISKCFITFIIVVFSFADISAQRIHFCDTTNRWVTVGYDSTNMLPVTSYYFYGYGGTGAIGDTEADGLYYFHLIDSPIYGSVPGGEGIYWVREDTTTGMVYFIPPPSAPSSLLYNFNLVTGDTIHFNSYGFHDGLTLPIIDSVIFNDSVEIAGQFYRRQTLMEIDTYWNYFCDEGENRIYTVIEGIGSLSKPNAFLQCGFYEQLRCFTYDSIDTPMNIAHPFPFASPFPNFTDTVYFTNDCASLTIPPVTMPKPAETVVCYPNPVNEQSILKCSQVIHHGTLMICNALGQETYITINEEQDIPIGSLLHPPGVYCYRLTDESTGEVFSGKIIVSP